MTVERGLTIRPRHAAMPSLLAFATAVFMLVLTAPAAPQEQRNAGPAEEPGFFGLIGRWFDRQAYNINSSFKDAGRNIDNLGHEAGIAARTTVDGAKGAADAVARIPQARVISGHQKCRIAANGAPDCVAAAEAVCRTKGFETGKSLDMTTAEICPPKVWMAGRNAGEGCRTETFVSRALCQ